MSFKDLPDFLKFLENNGQLHRIKHQVSSNLEITEISKRFLQNNGPALLFENVTKHDGSISDFPVITNLYASVDRIANGLGLKSYSELRELGKLLAFLRQPTPPESLKETIKLFPLARRVLTMSQKVISRAPCQEVIIRENIDINILPIQLCWPLDVSPLITWPIVVTKGPTDQKIDNYNLGIYRMQVISPGKLIMRWLKARGGAQQYSRWKKLKNSASFPAAIVLGSDPAITLSAVMPLPDNMSEYSFAGLLKGSKVELVNCITIDLKVPANAEIIIEGDVSLDEYLPEGPFGDHTGYYNDVELFPVFTVRAITMKKNPIYLSTYTGRPPDEPSILGEALNEIFIPIIQQQFPEIVDFWLPAEGCSYRVAVVSIKKAYPGHARRIMMGIWSFLRQFIYTKFVIVVDDDINVRNWSDVIWAISTRSDPSRDIMIIDNTPIDYLDFASIKSGIGGKMGVDATNKIHPETDRAWGEKIGMTQEVIDKIDSIWDILNAKK